MLKILDAGIQTTIQDIGRHGYQALGVPVSGAMDLFAACVANTLAQNPVHHAMIEIRSPLSLEAQTSCLIALTGAEGSIQVDGRLMPQWISIFVRAGSVIEIHPDKAAGWLYLAIHGGIATPRVLGSRSTFMRGAFGGFNGRALETGDVLKIGEPTLVHLPAAAGAGASESVLVFENRMEPVRVMLGPHEGLFSSDAIDVFLNHDFALTSATDRMGYRLSGPRLMRERYGELLSCGIPLGAIQVPPDGKPIALMADHQTTGGYPIIATVISADIGMLSQRTNQDKIRFAAVTIEKAHQEWKRMWKLLENSGAALAL